MLADSQSLNIECMLIIFQIQTQNAAGQATLGQLASNQGSTMVRPGLPQVQLIQQAVPGANFLQQQQQQLLYAAAVQGEFFTQTLNDISEPHKYAIILYAVITLGV